jgi:hypothetical protein
MVRWDMTMNRADEIAALTASIRDRGIEHIKVGVFDGDGILRGKYLRREKFLAALDKGMGFCNVVLGWDSNDQLFDNVKYTGWHTAYPDAAVRLLPETRRDIPFEPKTLLVLGEFAGEAEAVCPRAALRRVLARAHDMGYAVSASAEFEFFMFEETPESVREKGYRHLKTMTPGNFGYSVLRSTVKAELCQELLDLGQAMRFPIEGLHTETGADVFRGPRGGRSGGAVQDVHKGAVRAPGADGDIHGEVVADAARAERPPAYFAATSGRLDRFLRSAEAVRHIRPDALVHRRPADADA